MSARKPSYGARIHRRAICCATAGDALAVRLAFSNSFGFGGHIVCLAIRRYEA
jgi:3-oxoacyl-(acyl-carrier-protein) synthase